MAFFTEKEMIWFPGNGPIGVRRIGTTKIEAAGMDYCRRGICLLLDHGTV